MASLEITPKEGNFETVITVRGNGFESESETRITYSDILLDTVTTDVNGNFETQITPPNYVWDENTISASDNVNKASAMFDHLREPQYCTVQDVADWLRITINSNTDPNTTMIKDWIISNEDEMDIEMGHTFLKERQTTEVFNITRLWDWGRGLPIFPRHRNIRDFDVTKGDKFEVWNSAGWVDQSTQRIHFENVKGALYVKGYLFTILVKDRFRVTYRYGGNQEFQKIPKDIKRCAILMTALNVLETDFQMSQIPYGGEGNVDKDKIMNRWQNKINKILRHRSEITTIMTT